MEGPPLGPGGEDITWPDQVAPRGRKASSTRKIKPQTSNPATGVLRSVLAERERRVPDPPRFLGVLGPWVQAVSPGPVLPMLLHIVRYEREEVGFFMIL